MKKIQNIIVPLCLLFTLQQVQAQDLAEIPGWERDSVVTTFLAETPEWKNTSAISTVKGERLGKSFTQNVMNMLYGHLPGLTVMQGSGEPGADSPTLNARGFNTFSSMDRSVRVIIDGIESTLDQLAVQEIETVSLLKDAASASYYGMRGANGILLVTTKRGSVKPLEVDFNAQVGFNTPFKMPEFLGSYNYATLYDEALKNDGLVPIYEGTSALEAYRDGSNKYLYPNVNWYDEVLKKSSVIQNYNMNFSGGNEIVTYFALLNVSDNNGFFKGTDRKRKESANSRLTRYNVRANVAINVTKALSAELNLAANLQDQAGPVGGAWNVYNQLALLPPNSFPVHNPDNSYGGNATFSNPVGDLIERGYNSYNSRAIQSNLSLRYDFDALIKGLSVSATYSFNNNFHSVYNKTRTYPYFALSTAGQEYVYNQFGEKSSFSVDDGTSRQSRNTIFKGAIDYSRVFAESHSLDVNLHGYTDVTYQEYNGTRDTEFPHKYAGMRGRLSYGYDKRYIAEFSFGYEGSELYASGNRFGIFPAASLGWVISNEKFMKGARAVDYLKLRGSYGLTGGTNIIAARRYGFESYYAYTASYYLGYEQSAVSGLREDIVPDLGRTWEKEKRLNIGVDATILGTFDISLDYFRHDRYDILVNPASAIPGYSGLRLSEMNLGETFNSGFEASVRFGKKSKDLEYYAQVNVWYAKNNVEYMAEELRLWPNLVRTGRGIDQPFGLEALGLFRDEADIEASPEQTFGDVRPGDIKYRDTNADGRVDGEDVTPIGKPGNPEFSGSLILGLKYKGLDFEAMFYGVAGRTAYLSGNTYWAFQNQYAAPVSALGRWTEDNRDAKYPRLSTRANPNNTQYSSFWQHDGSFLKLRYVEVGYTLPKRWTDAIRMDNLRIYLNGTNLFSVHGMGNLKNADPEGLGGFPAMRTVSAGVSVKF